MSTATLLTMPVGDNFALVQLLNRGVAARSLSDLARALNVSLPNLANVVRISQRTLERRLASNADLEVDEAERALRVARLYLLAKDVFEDADEAGAWFREPLTVLGGRTPLEMCGTEPGAREVEQELGRIEHGVFS